MQPVNFLGQVLQEDLFRLAAGLFHIVNQEFVKIAGNYPARVLRKRETRYVLACLLERGEQGAVGLPDGGAKVLAHALLLNHHLRGRNVDVDEVGDSLVGKPFLYLVLKLDKANEVLDAENAHQQVEPKFLTFALLVALAGPFLDKLVGRCPLFGCLHRHLQFNFFSNIQS